MGWVFFSSSVWISYPFRVVFVIIAFALIFKFPNIISLILFTLVTLFSGDLTWGFCLLREIAFVIAFVLFCKLPNIRDNYDKVWYAPIEDDGRRENVQIQWYSPDQGGAWFPNFRILNDYIFPVCFVDGQGTPVSQMWCVKLEGIKRHGLYHADARISFLLKEAPESLLKTGNHFYIFNNKVKIGEGTVMELLQH